MKSTCINKKFLIGLVASSITLIGYANTASAAMLTLAPSNVIGGSALDDSGTAFNSGQVNATMIFDQQSGTINEIPYGQTHYWLSQSSHANAYIVIDLGAQYTLNQIDLYNTHNWYYNDRGTGQFKIDGANAVTDTGNITGYDIFGATSTILTGALNAQNGDSLINQSFSVSNTGNYRYLKFTALSVAAIHPISSLAYGLNEMKVYASAAPVPTLPAIWLIGSGLVGLFGFNKRQKTIPI